MNRKICSFLLVLGLILCVQTASQAQMTVINNASCTIFVSGIQEDMTTAPRCDWCNIGAITAVAPGGNVVFPRDLSCGRHVWSIVGWGTNSFGLTSSSWNPAYLGGCLPDIFAATCSTTGPALTATWLNSGAGPVTITIQ